MPTYLPLRSSSEKRATIPQNRLSTTASEELLEEVRQLRAALSVYRQLVDRLLTDRALGRVGKRERIRASGVNTHAKNSALALHL